MEHTFTVDPWTISQPRIVSQSSQDGPIYSSILCCLVEQARLFRDGFPLKVLRFKNVPTYLLTHWPDDEPGKYEDPVAERLHPTTHPVFERSSRVESYTFLGTRTHEQCCNARNTT